MHFAQGSRKEGMLVARGTSMGCVESIRGLANTNALLLLGALAASGCYRSASFDPGEVGRWKLDSASQSADIVTRDGERFHIAHYDSLVIEEAARSGRERWWQREHEYDAPVLVRSSATELEIQDAKRHAVYVPANVEKITFYDYAPKRTAIVFGVSAIAAGIVAFVLANAMEWHPRGDIDNRGHQYILVGGGALLTFGASLAIAFPLTSGLAEPPSPSQAARTASR
jgi:hypothetical protein